MVSLANFQPGPALDFSAITNALGNRRNEAFARDKLAIDQAIADRRISVEEGKLALLQLEAQTEATQTGQIGGLADQLGDIFPGGGPTVQGTPQVQGAPQVQGGLDALVTSQLGGGGPGQDVVPSTPQVTPPAPVQRTPVRVLSPDQISSATKIFNKMERVKAGSSEGFRDVLEFSSTQQLEIVKRDIAKQQRRAVQLKDEPFDKQKRLLAHFRRQDENDGLDVSAIEEMQLMDQEALGLEISSDLFLGEQGKKAIDLAITTGGEPEKATFTKGIGVIVENPDGTFSQAIPVLDSRTGEIVNKLSPIPGQPVSKLGETAEEITLRQIKEKRLIKRAQGEETQIRVTINDGITAAEGLGVINRSLELMKNIKTGGIEGAKIRFRKFLGIEGADEAELSANLLRTVLAQLRPTFGSQFTEAEGTRLERIEAGIGQSTAGNIRLLRQLKTMINREARRGLAAAKRIKDQFAIDEIDGLLKFKISTPTEDVKTLSDEDLLKGL